MGWHFHRGCVALWSLLLALGVGVSCRAFADVCFIGGDWTPQRTSYSLTGDSRLALDGADPVDVSGGLALREPSPCRQIGFWIASIESLTITSAEGSWVSPPQWVGDHRLDPPEGSVQQTRWPITSDSETSLWAEIDRWVEPVSDTEELLHTTSITSDPDGSRSIEWTATSGYLPDRLDLTLLVQIQTSDCLQDSYGELTCLAEAQPQRIGTLRLAAAPEAESDLGELACVAILVVARRVRVRCRLAGRG